MAAPAAAAQPLLDSGSAPAPAAPAPAKPKAAPKAPAAAAKPEAAAAPEAKPEAAKPKPEAKSAAVPAERREATIAKFARVMNADAEKDGVQVDAPDNERRQKPGPKPGAKRAKPEATDDDAGDDEAIQVATPPRVKRAAAAAPAATADETEADASDEGEADDDGDGSKPEARAVHQLKAKSRLRHGDVDKALRLAFGDMRPEEFEGAKEVLARKLGLGSKQWADFRRHEAAERAKTKAFEQNAVQLSQRLQADFGPMIQARKAFAEKNYPKAFELAFGEDINSFQRKAIHQHLSADPEKARLQQEIDQLKGEFARLRGGAPQQEAQQATPEQQQAATLQRLAQQVQQTLTEGDDGELAHFAKKPAFARRVVEIRAEHYDPQSRTTIPLRVAADMAREEKLRELDEWRYEPEATEAAAPSFAIPDQAGSEPVRTSARARSPLPSQAHQAGGATRSLSREERLRVYAQRMQSGG